MKIYITWSWTLLDSRLFIIVIVSSFEVWILLGRFSVRNSILFDSSLLFNPF